MFLPEDHKSTMAFKYYMSVEEEIPRVPVPYRLRLSDANKNIASRDQEKVRNIKEMPHDPEISEDKWQSFLHEFLAADDEECISLCPKCRMNDAYSTNRKDKSKKMIWVETLNMNLSSAKAAVFEKCWGKMFLGKRTFDRDPAPHIASCCHCKTILSPENTSENMRKKALEARKNMKSIRDRYKQKEAHDISEAMKRLEDLKRSIRENAEKARNEEKERLRKIKQISEERINSIRSETTKNINTKLEKNPFSPNHSNQGTTRNKKRSTNFLKLDKNQRKSSLSPTRKKSVNLFVVGDIPEIESSISDYDEFVNEANIDAELRKIEEMENGKEESRESSPELLPVELPDWVRDFLEKKKKAKEELEAAKSNPQDEMPIAVIVDDNNNDVDHKDIDVVEAEIDNSSNLVARQLDFTANIMAKKAPHPFGMASREIPDSCITASSQQDPFHRPNQARLNNEHSGKNAGAWCPKKHNNNEWLQIDLGKIRNIQQIAIQGMPLSSVKRPKDRRWVESFALSYSDSGDGLKYYEDENNNPKVFIGNTDLINTAKCSLVDGLETRFIRIHPVSWNNGIALRVEIYGEREKERDENIEENHLIPPDGTAFQKYGLEETEPPPIDFESFDDDDNHDDDDDDYDSAAEYIFQDDEDDLIEATDEPGIRAHSETADSDQETFKVTENDAISEVHAQEIEGNVEELTIQANDVAEHIEEAENTEELERLAKQREEELRKEAEERKRQLQEEAHRKFVEEMLRQERAQKRQKLMQNAVQKLTRRGSRGTGIVLNQEEEDVEDDFLSMYCILKESQKILYTRVFEQFDKDGEGFIDSASVVSALRALNLNVLKESEMMYIRKIISVFEPPNEHGIDLKTFNIIAAFSERMKHVDVVTRGFIRKTNFETLYLHAHKTRDLFERLLEGDERTISLEQFLIELEAGGVSDDNRKIVALNMKGRKFLDFLDFVLYYQLILYTHDNIMTAPL